MLTAMIYSATEFTKTQNHFLTYTNTINRGKTRKQSSNYGKIKFFNWVGSRSEIWVQLQKETTRRFQKEEEETWPHGTHLREPSRNYRGHTCRLLNLSSAVNGGGDGGGVLRFHGGAVIILFSGPLDGQISSGSFLCRHGCSAKQPSQREERVRD